MRKLIFILVGVFYFNACQAFADNPRESQLLFEAGPYLPYPAYVSQDQSGGTSLLNPVYFALGPQGSLFLGEKLRFEPGGYVLLPWRKNIDGNQRYFTSFLRMHAGYFASDEFLIRAGSSLQWIFMQGGASIVTQFNGTASSSFYTPNVSSSMFLASVDLAAAYYVFSRLRCFLELSFWNVGSSERRRMSMYLGVGYALF